MAYGTLKCDNIIFTNGGVDQTITVSGIVAATSGNLTVTGTISGAVVQGGTLVSGATVTGAAGQFTTVTGGTAGFTTVTGTTVTGTTANFISGVFTTQISGATVTGNTGQFTNITAGGISATTITGTTVTGTTANFASGVFTTQISGATVTGTTANFTSGNFTNISGGTHTITSGVFASGTVTNPSISFVGDSNTGIYASATDQVSITTNGTERLRVDAAGQIESVSLGTAAAPAYSFTTDPNTGIYSPGADQVAISTNGAQRATIDSSGRLLVGTNAARKIGGAFGRDNGIAYTEVFGTGNGVIYSAVLNRGDDQGPSLAFAKTRGSSVGSTTIVQSGDVLGELLFAGGDGTDIETLGARISAQVDGTPGANDMPGRLVFSTTSDNAASPTERMRLDSSGRLGLGTSNPGELLDITGGNAVISNKTTAPTNSQSLPGNIKLSGFGWNSSTGSQVIQGELALLGGYNVGAGQTRPRLGFSIKNSDSSLTEIASITSTGLGIGTTSPGSLLDISSSDPIFTVRNTNTSSSATSIITNIFSDSAAAGGRPGGEIRFIKEGTYTSGNGATYDSALSFNVSRDNVNQEAARIDSSGRLLVGTSTVRTVFGTTSAKVLVESVSDTDRYVQFAANTNSVGGFGLYLLKSRGTTNGSNTVVQSEDNLGFITFQGTDGTNRINAAEIIAQVDGTPGANDMPGRLVFSTTADGASSPTERMRIGNGGQFDHFFDSGNTFAFNNRHASAAGTTNRVFAGVHSATNNTNGTISIAIFTNGNVQNTNNSYGSLSDLKLKENITDASSQWEDLKAFQVRKYNFKEETGHETHTQIGLVAQEAELVSPGLVTESPDRDEEGNDLGTVTKSVNYSVLYMKAVKALQEAMERIEQLETSNADLLARVTALEAQ